MQYNNDLMKKHVISNKNLSTFTPCSKSYWHTVKRGDNMDYQQDDLVPAKGILLGVVIGVILWGLIAWGIWAWVN